MSNKFEEVTKGVARWVARRAALKKFGLCIEVLAVALSLASAVAAGGPNSVTSSVTDAAGDAVFPFNLYDGPVPPWIDVVQASVSLNHGNFHFEIKVNSLIPANGDPGLTPAVNHLGCTFGIQTDRKTANVFSFFGQQDNYYFNFLVGALYLVGDAGIGLAPGWHGFIQHTDGSISEIPLVIRGDTYIFETSPDSLANPASLQWAVGCECDPVPIPEEHNRTILVVDYAPDHGLASWPP